jgi:hypothetical protein
MSGMSNIIADFATTHENFKFQPPKCKSQQGFPIRCSSRKSEFARKQVNNSSDNKAFDHIKERRCINGVITVIKSYKDSLEM